jgi:hypothetical protein
MTRNILSKLSILLALAFSVVACSDSEKTTTTDTGVDYLVIKDGPQKDTVAPDKAVSDGPVSDGPVADGPVADGPVADGPVADGPVADGPVADGPVADGPVADGPVADGPVADGPVADGPVADGPVADGPVADGPVADGPVADGPVADGPVADGPVADGAPSTRVTLKLASAPDAISSYLLAGFSGWNLFHGATVYLGRRDEIGHASYHTALRFTQVAIPQGATIVSAKLSFYPQNSVESSNNLWINIYAEKATDSAAFDPSNYNSGRPDQRLKTSAFIDKWLVRCNASCTTLTEFDCPQRKLDCWTKATQFTVPKDLKALVQEVVNQSGWASGNALSILLINSATAQDGPKYEENRAITGYDATRGAQFAPELVIDYVP